MPVPEDGWFWQNPNPQGNTLRDIFAFDQNTAIAVGETGTIMKTTDGGKRWDVQHYVCGTESSEGISSVYFTDVNNGWVVGQWGTILNTTDGGTNWVAQTSGTSESL
jgi:photosystem II stability/assembly factor-like uncharacterized protein